MSIQEDLNNIKTSEKVNENVQEEVHEETHEEVHEEQTVKTQRSDPTKRELIAIAKKRAIDNFEKGIADPEYKVTKMTNGKYRCYKRKVDLPPEPVKQDQIPKNVRSSDVVSKKVVETDEIEVKPKNKNKDKHDPFADIVYFNLNNQMNEQLNKRLLKDFCLSYNISRLTLSVLSFNFSFIFNFSLNNCFQLPSLTLSKVLTKLFLTFLLQT